MLEIIANKLEGNLVSSNGHDLRILKLLKSGDCRLINPKESLCEYSTVIDIPGLGIRNYIRICISGKKLFRNIFIQDSFYSYQLSKLKFFISTRKWRKILFKDFFDLIRAGVREFFFYAVSRNLGFVSFDDALALKNVVIVSNGTNKIDVKPQFSLKDNKEFIFWGNMNYPPNLESVIYLLEQHWKGISKSVKNSSLELYGVISDSSKDTLSEIINEMNFNNVFIRGPFHDLSDITGGKIFLNCIQFGSGVKNKTLEALALGIPQICTKHALSGISLQKNIQSYDDFISKPQDVLDNLFRNEIAKLSLITWDKSCEIYKKNMVSR